MTLTEAEARALLDLAPSDTLVPREHVVMAPAGQTAAAPLGAAVLVLCQTATWSLVFQSGPVQVNRGTPHAIVAVSGADVTPMSGASERYERDLVLDARAGPASAYVADDGHEYLVTVSETEIDVVEIVRGEAEAWSPPERDVGVPPAFAELVAGWTVPDWLAARVDALSASGRPLDRIAAPATAARLWSAHGEEARKARADLSSTPAGRLRTWALAWDPAAAKALGELAAVELAALAEDLEWLDDATARRIVSRRDALESVRFALSLNRSAGPLTSLLHAFDREAVAAVSEFPPRDAFADLEWLRAVAWQDPDAWWGCLGEPS